MGGESTRMGRATGQSPPEIILPSLESPPPAEPIAVEVAQETLEVGDFATPAERGLAELAVHRYAEAIKQLRGALAQKPDDAEAMRGLAEALVASGGDLREARALAERLLQIAPGSVAGHEAMIRVCLAAHDAKCAFEHWKPANAAKDFGPRSRLFKDELFAQVNQAAADLRSGTAARPEAAAGQPEQDPCAQEQGEEKQVLCVVKRCLDAGSAEYAKDLSRQNNTEYQAGEWRTKPVSQGKMLVTREIATKGDPPQRHNAIWLVKFGEQLVIQPTNTEARQITLTHNACAARPAK
jgi:predicted Zn-dependent protease